MRTLSTSGSSPARLVSPKFWEEVNFRFVLEGRFKIQAIPSKDHNLPCCLVQDTLPLYGFEDAKKLLLLPCGSASARRLGACSISIDRSSCRLRRLSIDVGLANASNQARQRSQLPISISHSRLSCSTETRFAMGLALRDAQATADPALSPCYSAYFEVLFPYGSSSLYKRSE